MHEYGETLTVNIYEKAIKKIANQDLNNITPDFLENFSIERVRLFKNNQVLNLKKKPFYDSKFRTTKFLREILLMKNIITKKVVQ